MNPICITPSPCKFFSLCHKQTKEEHKLGSVAFLSKSAHNLLLAVRDKQIPAEERITDIEDVHRVISAFRETKEEMLRQDKPGEGTKTEGEAEGPLREDTNQQLLQNVISAVAPRIEAAVTNKVQKCESGGVAALDFPQMEDVAVFVTLHNDPATSAVFAWGVYVVNRKENKREFASGSEVETLVLTLAKIFEHVHQVLY
jgi:hypothetical protein